MNMLELLGKKVNEALRSGDLTLEEQANLKKEWNAIPVKNKPSYGDET